MFHGHMLLQDGNTSLHLASWEGHGEECDLLLGDKPEKVREALDNNAYRTWSRMGMG